VAKLNIGYFLEDVGHENFVEALVTRVALEMGFASDDLNHDVRNATGGKGTAVAELQRFLRDVKKRTCIPFCCPDSGYRRELSGIPRKTRRNCEDRATNGLP